MTNIPDGMAMKELRELMKEKEVSHKFDILYIRENKAFVKAVEKFEEIVQKLEGLQIKDKKVEITEKELRVRKLRSYSQEVFIRMVFVNPSSIPDRKSLESSLKNLDLGPPQVFNDKHEDGSLSFKLINCGNAKELKVKLRNLKIEKGEVSSVNTTSTPGSIIVKVQPASGHLKLNNIPEDCDAKKLKLKLKQMLSYGIEVKNIENGNADVAYKPKNMVILEKLSGLKIGEQELGIKEVEGGEESIEGAVGVPFPKSFTIKQLGNFLGDLIPAEIVLKQNSFSLNFSVESKAMGKIQEKVSNFQSKPKKSKKKKPKRRSWADEKEKEDEENNKASEINQNEPKIDVPVVFGSTDIRERRKSVGEGGSKTKITTEG